MKRHRPRRWVAVSTTTIRDPRVSPRTDPYAAQALVLVTMLIDDLGRLWQRIGKDEPELLGGPPGANGERG